MESPELTETRTMHAPPPPDNGEAQFDPAAARQQLIEAARKQADECAKAIQEVLQQHKCRIDVSMVATATGNRFQIEFVPVD